MKKMKKREKKFIRKIYEFLPPIIIIIPLIIGKKQAPIEINATSPLISLPLEESIDKN